MTSFERKYGYLLRFYPRQYRDERGPEMLAVLAEGGRPTLRERAALIVGGLRARLRTLEHRTVAGSWLSACYLAALALLLTGAAGELLRAVATPASWVLGQAVLSVLAVGFAAGRRHLYAALSAAGAVALDTIGRHDLVNVPQWVQPLAVLLLVPLIGRVHPQPPRRLALVLLPFVLLLEAPLLGRGTTALPLLLVLVLAVPLTALDHRIGLALALTALLSVANVGLAMKSLFWNTPDMLAAMWLPVLVPAVILLHGGILAHRRARL
ncbi:hypothetical protein [Actinoplanes sp. N902-109]|uniref:hypothetical protein n=1 Tax=Actinoplanes sp. (strain N902-109) TaxID=649831 RepID=UPI00032957AB|nr:hypothetical protein [Actinoplanes sp. N902-109]AGL16679.1 hypothetical protein L083_3169 [Actinoplanes sp. N902-109]